MTRAKDISKIVTDADLSGTLDVTGETTLTTHLNMGDGDIIKLGASADLQIYHDGSNSYVRDSGTGGLRLQAASDIRFVGNNTGENMLIATENSSVDLYYDNAKKLATTSTGIQVTGNIANASGDFTLDVAGDITLDADGEDIRLKDGGYEWGRFTHTGHFGIQNPVSNADIVFYGNDGGSTIEAMRIDMSAGGNVGIGTSSPTVKLDIVDDGVQLRLANSTTGTTTSDGSRIQLSGNDLLLINRESANMQFYTADTERMRITSGGTTQIRSNNHLDILDPDNHVSGRIRNVSSSSNSLAIEADPDSGAGGSFMNFKIDGSEHMRLTHDGVLMVGQTSFAYGSVGCSMTSSGQVGGTADGDVAGIFNRKTSDGQIINLRQDNSTIGGIYSSPSLTGPFIGHINVGLAMYHNGNSVLPSGTGGLRDNAIDLGNSSNRFDDIYATNSTIQTSDRNEKQDIEELSEAEQRVAVVAKGLMRKFRWIDSVAEKGDNARTHFGIIAQDLQDAFTAEGLDAGDYAMFTSTTWWEKEITVDAVEADEENGIEAQEAYTYKKIAEEATEGYTERTRLGVRYNQLLAFIISAI